MDVQQGLMLSRKWPWQCISLIPGNVSSNSMQLDLLYNSLQPKQQQQHHQQQQQ